MGVAGRLQRVAASGRVEWGNWAKLHVGNTMDVRTVVIGGNRAVFVETAKADFNQLFQVLAGER
jgi:roadblock/LC7 domain-containing protein